MFLKGVLKTNQTNRMVGCSATVAGRVFFLWQFFGVLNFKGGGMVSF